MEDFGTFKTGIDFAQTAPIGLRTSSIPYASIFSNDGDITLPNGVNFVALRETFLSEAPFVKRSNRQFWKKCIDSRQFGNLFGGTMRLVTECVLDNGTVDAKKLFIQPSKLSNLAMKTRHEVDAAKAMPQSSSSSLVASRSANDLLRQSNHRDPDAFLHTRSLGEADPYGFTTTSRHHVASTGGDLAEYQMRLLETISLNLAEMLLMDRTGHSSTSHDILFTRLPELLCFMIVNACIYALPKLTRLFYAIRFRELVMDYLNELIGGLRLTNCQQHREWLFKDAYDTNIVIVDPPNHLSTSVRQFAHISAYGMAKKAAKLGHSASVGSLSNTRPRTRTMSSTGFPPLSRPQTSGDRPHEVPDDEEKRLDEWTKVHCSGARSIFLLQNSPIVGMYLNSTRGPTEKPYACQHRVKINLTHFPARPVVSMQPQNVVGEGKFRDRRMDSTTMAETIQHCVEQRKQILTESQKNYSSMMEDVRKLNSTFNTQMEILERRALTQRLNMSAANSVQSPSANASVSGNNSVSSEYTFGS
jgi:hypothetical protein